MKKFMAMILMVIMMVNIGAAAFAADGRGLSEVEKYLLENGFEQSESDDSIWVYDGMFEDGNCHQRVKAYYDCYYDSGAAYVYDVDEMVTCMVAFKWSPYYGEFEDISSYEFD